MEFDAFLEHGVVLADERRFCQSGKRAVHEEPQESEEQPHFKETKMIMVEHGARNDEQVHVHKVGNEDEDAHRNDEARVALRVTGNQGVERNREVDEEHHQERHLVIAQDSAHVVRDFLRDVGVPNEQELAQPEVAPQHGDGEHPLAQIVHVAFVDFLEVPFAAQPQYAQVGEDHEAHPHAAEHVPPKERTEPVEVNRHHPITGHHRFCYNIKY